MKDMQTAHREKEATRILAEVAARFERTWGEALKPVKFNLKKIPRTGGGPDVAPIKPRTPSGR